ncbi:MAG: hypothetical protein WCF65_07460 [Parachlamydiaceae bacterium]
MRSIQNDGSPGVHGQDSQRHNVPAQAATQGTTTAGNKVTLLGAFCERLMRLVGLVPKRVVELHATQFNQLKTTVRDIKTEWSNIIIDVNKNISDQNAEIKKALEVVNKLTTAILALKKLEKEGIDKTPKETRTALKETLKETEKLSIEIGVLYTNFVNILETNKTVRGMEEARAGRIAAAKDAGAGVGEARATRHATPPNLDKFIRSVRHLEHPYQKQNHNRPSPVSARRNPVAVLGLPVAGKSYSNVAKKPAGGVSAVQEPPVNFRKALKSALGEFDNDTGRWRNETQKKAFKTLVKTSLDEFSNHALGVISPKELGNIQIEIQKVKETSNFGEMNEKLGSLMDSIIDTLMVTRLATEVENEQGIPVEYKFTGDAVGLKDAYNTLHEIHNQLEQKIKDTAPFADKVKAALERFDIDNRTSRRPFVDLMKESFKEFLDGSTHLPMRGDMERITKQIQLCKEDHNLTAMEKNLDQLIDMIAEEWKESNLVPNNELTQVANKDVGNAYGKMVEIHKQLKAFMKTEKEKDSVAKDVHQKRMGEVLGEIKDTSAVLRSKIQRDVKKYVENLKEYWSKNDLGKLFISTIHDFKVLDQYSDRLGFYENNENKFLEYFDKTLPLIARGVQQLPGALYIANDSLTNMSKLQKKLEAARSAYTEILERPALASAESAKPDHARKMQQVFGELNGQSIAFRLEIQENMSKFIKGLKLLGVRESLGQWRGPKSRDNIALNENLTKLAYTDADYLESLDKALDLVKKGLSQANRLDTSGDINITSEPGIPEMKRLYSALRTNRDSFADYLKRTRQIPDPRNLERLL